MAPRRHREDHIRLGLDVELEESSVWTPKVSLKS